MGCEAYQNCGGCVFRELDLKTYQGKKENQVRALLEEKLGTLENIWQTPLFMKDGSRRRAAFAFEFKKNRLVFGFNENKSNQIVDVEQCQMMSKKINEELLALRGLVEALCKIVSQKKIKGKKFEKVQILNGDLQVLEAENGLDVVLETEKELSLEHRMEICDFMNSHDSFVRFSWRKKHAYEAEPILEKTKPFIKIGEIDVFVAPGDFLQASKEGEQALVKLVLEAIGQTRGKMADLFCGIGTFSYALSALKGSTVLAVDVSKSLLKGFQNSIDRQMIQNIKIKEKNLFLYPLTAEELEGFDVIVFDPPRAGAKAQVKELCLMAVDKRVQKIVGVSCNPETFARDAKMLVDAGYKLKKITMVDQFVYSDHSEIVALFTNEK